MSSKKRGIKLLLVGLSNSGKSTLASKIEESMFIAVDGKAFPFDNPHYRVDEWNGIVDFRNTLVTKIKAYKEKYGKLPKTVVLDTVTKLYEHIYEYCQDNYKGFDQFNALIRETLALNKIIESTLVNKGINTVIVAHATQNNNTNNYEIPAKGQFAESGGWLSVVDEASFLYVLGNDRYIAHKELKYPCRSTLDIPESEMLSKYDINKHIGLLEEQADKSEVNTL